MSELEERWRKAEKVLARHRLLAEKCDAELMAKYGTVYVHESRRDVSDEGLFESRSREWRMFAVAADICYGLKVRIMKAREA